MKICKKCEKEIDSGRVCKDCKSTLSTLDKILNSLCKGMTFVSTLICGIIGFYLAGIPGLIIGLIVGLCI